MHKAECLIKHGKTKDGSSTRSLDYLTMEQAAHGISDGMYTYKHRCEGGVDIHDIVVKKSRFRILLYHIGTICLLMTVCRILLAKVRNEKHNSIEINQLCISVAELHSFPEFLSNIGSDLNQCSNLCLKYNLIILAMFLVRDALFLLLAYKDSVGK